VSGVNVAYAGKSLGAKRQVAASPPKAPNFIPKEQAAALSGMAEVLEDPVKFVRVFLNHDPWPMQADILRSVADNQRTVVKACNASSKSYAGAEAALWWIARYRDGVAITTAPTFTQVEKVMWAEIHKAVRGSLWPFPKPLQTELRLSGSNYALGISTNEGVRFQGYHGRILIIFDEGVGIQPDIWEAVEGNMAGGDVHLLSLGNPTIPGGPFHAAFSSPSWTKFTIDAFGTPNFEHLPGKNAAEKEAFIASLRPSWAELSDAERELLAYRPRPYLIDPRWVHSKYNDWGPDSPMYQSRVRGQFPTEDPYALISSAWTYAARNRDPLPGLPLVAGLDIAGPGDDETALYLVGGDAILKYWTWRVADPVGPVAAALMDRRSQVELRVDNIGMGWGVANELRRLGFNVIRINGQAPASDQRRFANAKAELYWQGRERLKAGRVAGLSDDITEAQLLSLRYFENERGQIQIESKKDLRKANIDSPDRAEALLMAVADSRRQKFRVY